MMHVTAAGLPAVRAVSVRMFWSNVRSNSVRPEPDVPSGVTFDRPPAASCAGHRQWRCLSTKRQLLRIVTEDKKLSTVDCN